MNYNLEHRINEGEFLFVYVKSQIVNDKAVVFMQTPNATL